MMPQNKQNLPKEDVLPKKVFAWVAIASTAINSMLATTLLSEVWFGVIMWICGG